MSDLSESARVAELRLGCPVEPWSRLGFAVHESSEGPSVTVAGLGFRFVDGAPGSVESAVTGWTLVGATRGPDDVDGIATRWIDEPANSPAPGNRVHVSSIDHIVIMTGSLDRTSECIDRILGAPRKRVRDAGGGVRQGFHRAGDIILEVVERPDLDPDTAASLWGVVFVVDDLDATVAWLGPDAVSAPRDAVQPGRRIASIRREVGLGLPVALMTPHVR